MRKTIFKISIHLLISSILTSLEHLVVQFGGQAFPLDRFCFNENLNVNVF
ncbi:MULTISPECIES: hypothetical protein [Flavobacterium]|uniref:Uncharacterized protein n=1 Tax=Flavobacterium algoritolerans TaxID=3041254 RepID=A0ABT6VEC1_9FLAO|nr:hypothetical protein [Flavobacterium algoritolerans]MDI5895357.1 hypothetical protein [Flavobacterium algoritolerans]